MNKCCGSCAFLACNKDKPNPTDLKNKQDYRWYAQANIDRLWNEIKKDGSFLTCHSTDPNYYGKDHKNGWVCTGMVLCVYMHVKVFESLMDSNPKLTYPKYKEAVGKQVAMSRFAMGEVAISLNIGRTSLIGGYKITRSFYQSDFEGMRYPTGFEKTVEAFKEIIHSKQTV